MTTKQGWNVPKPAVVPKPTSWPATMALGILFTAWGLITSPILIGVGVALVAISLAGWIGDIRYER